MTKIAVMRKNFDGTEWKRAFATSLIALWPDMNPDRADEVSDTEYLRSRSLDPGAAAHHWVSRQSPNVTPDEADPAPSSSVG